MVFVGTTKCYNILVRNLKSAAKISIAKGILKLLLKRTETILMQTNYFVDNILKVRLKKVQQNMR